MTNKGSSIRKRYTSLLLCALVIVSAYWTFRISPAQAQEVQNFQNNPATQITNHMLRKKAPPDECWAYLANPSPLPKYTDPTRCSSYPVPEGMPKPKPKVNQSYIWGLTENGDNLWWGTFANGNCVTQAGTVPVTTNPNGSANAHATDAWTCEFYDSPYYPSPFPDARIGDARSPRAYQYSKSTQVMVDKTPRFALYASVNNPEGIMPVLIGTRGIRSALSYNGLIILAGPALDPTKGLNFFAWNATTGTFLGAQSLLGYNNIRQFLVLNGIPYTAVGKNDCSSPTSCTSTVIGGRILRIDPTIVAGCTFNPSFTNPNPTPCFLLNGATNTPAEVGNLDTVAGSLTAHNGRIYTVTWPSQDLPGVLASLYQSPSIPAEGLTTADAGQWHQLWKANDYEPDPNIAQFYAGGALASFDGYLWWGTLHIPMQPFLFLNRVYPPTTTREALEGLLGTFRATVFFRGKDLESTNPQIEIAYGNRRLPVFTPAANGNPQNWSLQPNRMRNPIPLFGPAGFGNIWNNYTWSATVWNNRLWVGTMDWSFSAKQGNIYLSQHGVPNLPTEMYITATFGADLFYFTSGSKPAFAESSNGVDNPTSYGVRNQLPSNNGNLFLGMANPQNLLTDPGDPKHLGGMGGWELIELSPSTNLNTPVGTNVAVTLPGAKITYCSVTNAGTTFTSTVRNPLPASINVDRVLEGSALNAPLLPNSVALAPVKLTMLWTSALWGQGCTSPGVADVSLPIPTGGDVTAPRLVQLQWDGNQYLWKDVTTSVDFTTGQVTGTLTADFLGVLGVAQGTVPKLSASITGKGFDANSSLFVDVLFISSSDVPAKDARVTSITVKAMNGSGSVTYDTARSSSSQSLGDLAPGASKVVRYYLKSTTGWGLGGVLRLSIAEGVRMNDVFGQDYTGALNQFVVP